MKPRCLWIVIAMVVVVAACTVAPDASPAPSPSPTPNPNQLALASRSPRPTASPTVTASPTPTAPEPSSASPWPSDAYPDLPHADRELEAYLPASLSGTPLIRFSALGSIFTSGGDMCLLICGGEPYNYAKELGITVDDITIAFVTSDKLAIGIIAYRARGAKTDRLIPARIAIGGYTGHGFSQGVPVEVAGRPAMYLDAGFGERGEYLMTRHDVLFIVLGDAPSKGTCNFGKCASLPPGPWNVPASVAEALGAVP
jgi:hypothetical protein